MNSSNLYTANINNIIDATMNSAAMTGLLFGIIIFAIILGLISIISYWKIFNKAGKPGWASIIPIYNYIVMIQIAKLSLIYLLLLIVPLVNIFAIFKINIRIAKKFGKTSGFGVGMTLLSIIFIPLLAFSDNIYEDNIKEVKSTIENNSNIINENVEEVKLTPIENNINDINQVSEVTPPVIENTNVETNLSINNDESIIEETANENTPIINAFNTTPTESNLIEETPTLNVKINNDIPVNETEILSSENTPQPITEIPVVNENINQTIIKKVCKNCGETLPSIVSICPKCGTDNE